MPRRSRGLPSLLNQCQIPDTFNDVFARLNPDAFETCFRNRMTAMVERFFRDMAGMWASCACISTLFGDTVTFHANCIC
jgi:hypothetical protein